MVDKKNKNIETDENEVSKEKYLKFGRDKRIAFSSRDMWIEEYRDVESIDRKTKKVTKKKAWIKVTGYCSRVKHLLRAYERVSFITHHGNLDEYKAICSDIHDAIDKIPDWLVTTHHSTPVVIIEEKKIYITEEQLRREKEARLREAGINIIKIEEKKNKKRKTRKTKKTPKKVANISNTDLF